jgi:hypothetical protein
MDTISKATTTILTSTVPTTAPTTSTVPTTEESTESTDTRETLVPAGTAVLASQSSAVAAVWPIAACDHI